MVPWLASDDPFPPVERALGEASGAPGLLAASAELQSSRLVDAYQHGIFPWYSDGQPVLWWSPDPRMVLIPDEFKVSDSLRKTLRRVLGEPTGELPGAARGSARHVDHGGYRGSVFVAASRGPGAQH